MASILGHWTMRTGSWGSGFSWRGIQALGAGLAVIGGLSASEEIDLDANMSVESDLRAKSAYASGPIADVVESLNERDRPSLFVMLENCFHRGDVDCVSAFVYLDDPGVSLHAIHYLEKMNAVDAIEELLSVLPWTYHGMPGKKELTMLWRGKLYEKYFTQMVIVSVIESLLGVELVDVESLYNSGDNDGYAEFVSAEGFRRHMEEFVESVRVLILSRSSEAVK